MALPPTIPTSFVPKQPVATNTRKRVSGLNPFLTLAYVIFGIAFIAALATFGYKFYLDKVANDKAAQVSDAQKKINLKNVSSFIRTRDRFTVAQKILDNHVATSFFFTELENITLQNVRFTGLRLKVEENRTASIEMAGTARTFNALAVESSAFAADTRFKRAIFSSFVLDPKTGEVKFSLKADVDPSLIIQRSPPAGAPLPTEPAAPTPTPAPATPAQSTTTTPKP